MSVSSTPKKAWPTIEVDVRGSYGRAAEPHTHMSPQTPGTIDYGVDYFGRSDGPVATVASSRSARSPTRSVYVESPKQRKPMLASSPARPVSAGSSLEYSKKVLGERVSPVWELNPTTPSQQIRLKHRASTLIQRYAGTNWREAQRSKWLLDVVTHIDKDYREYILDQATHIQHLQEQVLLMQQSQGSSALEAQSKIMDLGQTVQRLESELRDSSQVILDLQTRLARAESALHGAEQAASVADHECAELQQAVQLLAENEAHVRKSMAHRNFMLKDGLRQSQGRARQLGEAERRHKLEVQVMCKLHDQDITKERAHLEQRMASQVAAVQAVEQASAQIAVERVRLEMEAYKEPWSYLHGKKSPTANAQVAKKLGLRMASLSTLYVPP